ncbi:MAG: zinc ribbon domain-containing protein [Bacteroidota bacterium]
MKQKECPSCAMEIDAKSKECPICGYEFSDYSGGVKWIAILLVILFIVLFLIGL